MHAIVGIEDAVTRLDLGGYTAGHRDPHFRETTPK